MNAARVSRAEVGGGGIWRGYRKNTRARGGRTNGDADGVKLRRGFEDTDVISLKWQRYRPILAAFGRD